MMASHRWSHTPPQRVPAAVQLLQSAGVLMSQEHHSDHRGSSVEIGQALSGAGLHLGYLHFLTGIRLI